jgi:hypothetical protein
MDALMGFLNNPLVLTGVTMGFGLLATYHPKLADLARKWISYINVLIAFVVKATAPPEAHADTLYLLNVPMVSLGAGLLGAIGASVWQSVQSYLLYKVFLHDPIEKRAGGLKPLG